MADLNPATQDAQSDQREPAAQDLMREQRLQRNLKVLVAFLGLLILAGLAGVVIRVMYLASQPRMAPVADIAPPGDSVTLELPAGARIVSVSATDQRIVVHHDGPSGAGIAVLDLRTGQRLLEIEVRAAAPTTSSPSR